jgi:hypothetical protein
MDTRTKHNHSVNLKNSQRDFMHDHDFEWDAAWCPILKMKIQSSIFIHGSQKNGSDSINSAASRRSISPWPGLSVWNWTSFF